MCNWSIPKWHHRMHKFHRQHCLMLHDLIVLFVPVFQHCSANGKPAGKGQLNCTLWLLNSLLYLYGIDDL